jgi:hypothetical protein
MTDLAIEDINPDLEIHNVLLGGRYIPGNPPSGRKQSSKVQAIGAWHFPALQMQ